MLITDRFSSSPSLLNDLGASDTLQAYPRVQDQESELFSNLIEQEMEKISSGIETQDSFWEIQEGKGEAGIRTDEDLYMKKEDSEENQIFDKSWTQGVMNQKSVQRFLSPRQIVMQKFMDSIESEFGIPPEVFVGAMAKLSDQGLRASPREMTSQIIRELDLPEKEAVQLAIQYQQMLTQLERLVLKAQMEPPAQEVQLESQPQRTQFFPKEGRLPEFHQPEFHQPESHQPESRRPMVLPSMASDLSKDPPHSQLREIGSDDLNYGSREEHRSIMDDWGQPMTDSEIREKPKGIGIVTKEALPSRGPANQDNRIEFVFNKPSLMKKTENPSWRLDNLDQVLVPERSENKVLTGEAFKGVEKNQEVSSNSFPANSTPKDSYVKNSFSGLSSGEASIRSLPLAMEVSGTTSGVQRLANSEAGDPIEKNIARLLNQAQFIIKKGGGEASIKLIPEGLGQVHLHVTVDEGRVSLQMVAETKEAKSLIEGALRDLQSSLGVHHLSVDHVKVNIANEFSNDKNGGGWLERNLQQQSGFDFNQGREQARQFLNNSQDGHLAYRNQAFESPSSPSHGPGKAPVPVQSGAGLAGSPRYVGEGRGTGLNLIV